MGLRYYQPKAESRKLKAESLKLKAIHAQLHPGKV